MNKLLISFVFLLFFSVRMNADSISYSGSLPVLFIETHSQITSKDEYVDGTYYLESFGHNGYENIGNKDNMLPLEIRYRGNYTLKKFAKKPYKIKFKSKTEILGMKKNKHFALLAHADANRGFLRNTVGFEIARLQGMDFVPEQRPVELVLNGSYEGLYFLTETVRVDKNRLKIDEQKDSLEDVVGIENGGWLVEMDNYEDPNQIQFDVEGTKLPILWITFHTPEFLSKQQSNYIKNQFELILDIIRKHDYQNDELEKIIDYSELAKYYLSSEIIDHQEAFLGSCFLHKNNGGKWRFGPVWDFGTAFIETHDKDKFIYEDNIFHHAGIIEEFIEYPQFMQAVYKQYKQFRDNYYEGLFPFIDAFAQEIKYAAANNYKRWPQHGNKDVIERSEYVKDCLQKKIAYLDLKWGGQINGIETKLRPEVDGSVYTIQGNKIKDGKMPSKGLYIKKENGKFRKYINNRR